MTKKIAPGSATNPAIKAVEHEAKYPYTNDPDSPLNSNIRTRFVIGGQLYCPSCATWKSLTEDFHKAKNLPFGVCGICKECARARRKAHYWRSKQESPYRDADGKLTLRKSGGLPKKFSRGQKK